MVKVTIVGWYGTETLGDRAILAGLFRLMVKAWGTDIEIALGSLIPMFTNRTVYEDIDFYKQLANAPRLTIKTFDSLKPGELRKSIKHSDVLMIGGGPLMDIEPMYMLEYAMLYASRLKRKTVVAGCGWGPLKIPEYIRSAKNIVDNADIAIFRDEKSLHSYLTCGGKNSKAISTIDPAFIAAYSFHNRNTKLPSQDLIAVNFRDVTLDQYDGDATKYEKIFTDTVQKLLNTFPDRVLLVPMHSFSIGGDDRYLLNHIKRLVDSERVIVANDPMSLECLMKTYYTAKACVGMRFHSVVLQTALNGNNYILDYTDPEHGKTISMLHTLGIEGAYTNRYYNLIRGNGCVKIDATQMPIPFDWHRIKRYEEEYVTQFKQYLVRTNDEFYIQ